MIGSIVGALVGKSASAGDARDARNLQSEAIGAIKNIKVPTVDEMRVTLEKMRLEGTLTPELEVAIEQEITAQEKIQTDPDLTNVQKDYLSKLRLMGDTGLTAEERGELNAQRQAVTRDTQAKMQDITREFQQRGAQGVQGMELAQKLAGAQGAADRASSETDRTMAMAQQRALGAMAQAGNLAQSMSKEDYTRQLNLANARDTIANFNVQQRAGVQNRNVGSKNLAQAQNLAEKQRISDTNVNIGNQQEMHNKSLPAAIFNMEMAKANALAPALSNAAISKQAAANQVASGYAQAGSAWDNLAFNQIQQGRDQGKGMANSAASSGGGFMSMFSDKRTKKDIEKFDAKKFLDSLHAIKYNYKEEFQTDESSKKPQVGVMAQEIEKEVPQAIVENEDGYKMVDPNKLSGPMLASLADLHERLKKLEEK